MSIISLYDRYFDPPCKVYVFVITFVFLCRQLVTSPSFRELEQQITDALKANRNGKRSRQQTKELSAMETQETKWREAASDYRSKFVGHCNTTTDIKEAGFLGQNGEFIMAGSDDGSFFIWDRESTNLVKGNCKWKNKRFCTNSFQWLICHLFQLFEVTQIS